MGEGVPPGEGGVLSPRPHTGGDNVGIKEMSLQELARLYDALRAKAERTNSLTVCLAQVKVETEAAWRIFSER